MVDWNMYVKPGSTHESGWGYLLKCLKLRLKRNPRIPSSPHFFTRNPPTLPTAQRKFEQIWSELCVAKCTKHTSGLSFSFDANSSLVFHDLCSMNFSIFQWPVLTHLNPSQFIFILTHLGSSYPIHSILTHLIQRFDPSHSTSQLKAAYSMPSIIMAGASFPGVNDIKLAPKT